MDKDQGFYNHVSAIWDTYRHLSRERDELEFAKNKVIEAKTKDVETREALISDLLRALTRAQEIIIDLGEKSGNAELLKDAKIYANAIGDVAHGLGPEPYPDYSKNPMVKYHWSNVNRDGSPKGKKPSKRQRRAK